MKSVRLDTLERNWAITCAALGFTSCQANQLLNAFFPCISEYADMAARDALELPHKESAPIIERIEEAVRDYTSAT